MACPDKVCDNSAVTTTLSGAPGTFTFTEYVSSGALVEFGDTEHSQTIQRSNTGGKFRRAGNNYVTQPITINAFACDPAFERFYAAYIANPMNFCFDTLVVNDPCCTKRSFKDVYVTSVNQSDVTNDDTQSTINLEGIPLA